MRIDALPGTLLVVRGQDTEFLVLIGSKRRSVRVRRPSGPPPSKPVAGALRMRDAHPKCAKRVWSFVSASRPTCRAIFVQVVNKMGVP